ncbi:unnamed protein product [Boreogadus saida]
MNYHGVHFPDTNRGQALSGKQLLQVAETLGQEWGRVGVYLDLSTTDLDDIKEGEADVTMQKLKMLERWKRRTPGVDLSDEQLRDVAKMLGQKWKQAALHLGLKNEDLDEIKKEKKVFMQRRNMLRLWKDQRPGKTTAQDLLRGLEDMEDLPDETRLLLKVLDPLPMSPAAGEGTSYLRSSPHLPLAHPAEQATSSPPATPSEAKPAEGEFS